MISGFTVRFLGMYVIDNRGLGLGVFMAMLVNLAGGWLRFFGGLPTSCPNSTIAVKDCPNPTSDRKSQKKFTVSFRSVQVDSNFCLFRSIFFTLLCLLQSCSP